MQFQAIFHNKKQYQEAKIETLQIYDIKETSMKMSVWKLTHISRTRELQK